MWLLRAIVNFQKATESSLKHTRPIQQCPNYFFRFALGPLELRVIKTLDGSTSSAAAVTDTMLGLMDMQIDTKTSSAAITDVYFDEPGGVSVTGNLKRKRAHLKHNSNGYSPYRLQVASRAKKSLEQVARLVVASDKKWKKIESTWSSFDSLCQWI